LRWLLGENNTYGLLVFDYLLPPVVIGVGLVFSIGYQLWIHFVVYFGRRRRRLLLFVAFTHPIFLTWSPPRALRPVSPRVL